MKLLDEQVEMDARLDRERKLFDCGSIWLLDSKSERLADKSSSHSRSSEEGSVIRTDRLGKILMIVAGRVDAAWKVTSVAFRLCAAAVSSKNLVRFWIGTFPPLRQRRQRSLLLSFRPFDSLP